jgi:hypothetical protein
MAIGDALTESMPTVGVTAGPTWASDINAWAAEVEAAIEAMIDSDSITLTTGDVIHSTRRVLMGAGAGQGSSGATWTPPTGSTAGYYLATGAADTVEFHPRLEANQRITACRITGRCAGVTAWTAKAWLVDSAAGTRTQLGTTQTSGTAAAIEEMSITSLTTTLADGQYIELEWTSGAANNRCLAAEVQYDRTVAT